MNRICKYCTDNDIIQALECCANINDKDCTNCPYPDVKSKGSCVNDLRKDALDLINRQQAEIERLRKDNEYILMQHKFDRRPNGDCWNDVIEKAKTEAIKEFAERLKAEYADFDELHEEIRYDNLIFAIDDLVKEMTESVNYGSSKMER